MRVLHVIESARGGVPLFVRRLCEGLRESFTFEIACRPDSELYRAPPIGATLQPVQMCRQIHPVKDLLTALRIRSLARSNRYDIVHLNSSKAGVIGLILRGRLSAKTIFTPHALRSHAYQQGSPLRRAARFLEARICRSVDLVVAVGQEEQRQLTECRTASAPEVRLIENGVDLRSLESAPKVSRTDLGLPADAFVVGTVGRLSPQKDPASFARAAILVATRLPEAHFVMVGDGPGERDVRRLIAEAGLLDRFHILGWRTDAAEILKLFDVFILTSRYEGLPFALLEAAGARRAIVCTKAPGLRSLIDDGRSGLLVDIGDPEAIAEAVIRLRAEPDLRARLGEGAFEAVAQPRSLELMLERWSDLYRSLVGQVALAAEIAGPNLSMAER